MGRGAGLFATFRRIRRSIAALLLVLYVPACHYWVTPKGITPEAYIAAEQPKQVRVTLRDGTRQTILDPSIFQDSLLGNILIRQSNNFLRSGPLWAVPLGSVRRLEVYKLNTGVTVGATVGGMLLVGLATVALLFIAVASNQ